MLKYSVMINGIDSVAITKLDVLNCFDELKVCVGYELNGKRVKSFPTDLNRLEKIKPVYKTLPGWNQDISGIRNFDDLPQEAKNYLNFLSEECSFKIKLVSVGPKRSQTIEL